MKYFITTFFVFVFCLTSFAKEEPIKNKQFTEEDCLKTGIKPLTLNSGEKIMPRYDGEHYFIDIDGFRSSNLEEKPSPLLLQKIVDEAENGGKIITLNASGVEQLITGNFGGVFQSFPVVLKLSTPNCYVVLLSLTFKTNETKLDIGVLSESEITNSDGQTENFYFGARDLTIKNGGGITGKIDLIAPKSLDIFSLKNVGFLTLGAGSGFCLGCDTGDKIAQLILAGTFDFNPSFAHVEKKDATTGEIKDDYSQVAKMNYSVNIIDWKEVQITMGLPQTYGIQFTQFKDIGFWNKLPINIDVGDANRCANPYGGSANVTLDLSSRKNPDGMITCGGTALPLTWTGLYFGGFEVRFPKTLRKNGVATKEYLKADLDYFYISENGINAKGGTDAGSGNLFGGDSFKLGEGFDVKLQKIGIEICANKLTGFIIAGALRLPVNGLDNYELGFDIGLATTSANTNASLNSLAFGVRYTESQISLFNDFVKMSKFTIGVGTTTIIQDFNFDNLTISLTGINNANGSITVGDPTSTLGALILEFYKLVVTNKPPFVTEFTIFPKPGSNSVSLFGFSVGLSAISLKGNTGTETTAPKIEGTACVTLELDKGNGADSQNSTIGGAAKLAMKAEWEKDAPKEKYHFKNFDVSLTGAAAYASFPMFGFRGCIDVFKNATKYGASGVNGFEGSAAFWVNFADSKAGSGTPDPTPTEPPSPTTPPNGCDCVVTQSPSGDVTGNAHLLFMKVAGETAWAANVGLKINNPASAASPISINEIFGGAYKNLRLKGAADESGLSNDYKYDVGNWGFNLGLGMALNTYNADLNVSIAAQGKKGEGLEWIKGMAYLKFKLDVGDIAKKIPGIGKVMAEKLGDIQQEIGKIGTQVQTFTADVDNALGSNLFGSTEPISKNAIQFLSKSNDITENKVAAGAVLTLNFRENFFSLLMYPDININIAQGMVNARSQGKGVLYLSANEKYFFLGKSAASERIGLNFEANMDNPAAKLSINAFVNTYFMVGNKGIPNTLPAPLVPDEFLAEFRQKEGSETIQARRKEYGNDHASLSTGAGIAFGAAIGVKADFTAAYVFKVDAKVGAGFDALLTNAACSDDNGWGGTGSKNWRASAQVYGYANASVKMFFVNIASLGVAFLLEANVPKPLYAKGEFLVYASIWKAKAQLKVKGEFGSPVCLPEPPVAPPILVQEAKLIEKLEPTIPVAKDGNLFLSFKNPFDQLRGVTQSGSDNWKQKVIVKFFDNGVEVGSGITISGIDPQTTANLATILPLAGTGLVKGKTYKAKIETYIYTDNFVQEYDGDGKPTGMVQDGTDNIIAYKDNENTVTKLHENQEYNVTISNVDFLLNPADVLLYPAKNQYNTYLSDFGGEGYFRIEPQYGATIKTSCPSCQFSLGIYGSGGNLIGGAISITDIANDFNFPLPNLSADNIYQIKVTATQGGTSTIIYDKHYFRVAKLNSFNDIITSLQNNQQTSYSSSNLSFSIKANDSNIVLSKEEINELITSTIDFEQDSWFQSVPSCFGNLQWSPMKGIVQNKSYSIENGNITIGTASGTGTDPEWSYAPFDPAVFDAFGNLSNSQDLAKCLATCTDADERVRDICINDCNRLAQDCADAEMPDFGGQHCFSIDYDIKKLSYYITNVVGSLPSRFAPITGGNGICFDVEPPIDFNDLNKLQKTIEITCKRSSMDSHNLEYEIRLKKDNVYISFPENITVSQSLPKEKYEITKEGAKIQIFASTISSKQECPLAENFSVSSIKYNIEVKPDKAEVTPNKPCITFKDVSIERAVKECEAMCPDQCDCESNPNPTSAIVRIEGWETDPGKYPQTFHEKTDIVFSNGKTVSIPKGASFLDVDLGTLSIPNDLKIIVDANSLYKCGDNLDKLPLNSLTNYTIVGKGANATTACGNTLTPNLNIYGEKTISNLVVGSNGTKFYANDIAPLTKATDAYYVKETNGIKEYFHVINGILTERNYCVSQPFICMDCKIDTYTSGGRKGDSYRQFTFTFYTDNTKTKTFIPYNIPSEGLNVVLSDGSVINIPKADIKSTSVSKNIFASELNPKCQTLVSSNLPDASSCNPPDENCSNKPTVPTLVASNATPSFGETITLTANCGANKIVWFNAETSPTISIVATKNSEYWAKCLNNNCLSNAASQIIKIREPKIITLKEYVCSGSSITLSVEGCTGSSINWTANPVVSITTPNAASITVSPTVDTKFVATCTSSNGGSVVNSSPSKEIKFYQSPSAITISTTNNTKICLGESISLSATPCQAFSSLVWNPSVSNNSNPLQVSPLVSTTYNALCKSLYCESTASNNIDITVFSMTRPAIANNALNGKSCAGKSVMLTSSACGSEETVFWYVGTAEIGTGTTKEVFPRTTTTYTAKCRREIYTGKWCESQTSNSTTVAIITDMSITETITKTDICAYQSTVINTSSCPYGEVQWRKNAGSWSVGNIRSKTLNGTDAGTYYVRCNLNNNCYNAEHNPNNLTSTSDVHQTLTVHQEPTPNIASLSSGDVDNAICDGTAISLSGTCSVGSIAWSLSDFNNKLTSISELRPANSTTYYAYCQNQFTPTLECHTQESNRKSLQMTVHHYPSRPSISASLNNTTNQADICSYDYTNISVSSCSADGNDGTHYWKINGGSETTTPTLTNINTSNNYEVRCQVWECSSPASDVFNLYVHTPPTKPVISTTNSGFVCQDGNGSITLSTDCPSNTTVHWYNSSNTHLGTGSTHIERTVQNTTYTAKCEDNTYHCYSDASDAKTVDIRSIPNTTEPLSSQGWTICNYNPTNISSSCQSDATENWLQSGHGFSAAAQSGTYEVKCDRNGCSSESRTKNLTVYGRPSAPTISKSNNSAYICGGTITLTANCSDVSWSNGENTQAITVSSSGTYSAKCIANGCESLESTSVSVDIRGIPSAPSLSASPASICSGQSSTLSSSCGGTVSWRIGSDGDVTPGVGTTAYYASCVNNGCTSSTEGSTSVTVNAYPLAPTVTPTYHCGSTNLTINNCTGGTAHFEWGGLDLRHTEANGFAANPFSYDTYCEKNGCTTKGSSYTPSIIYYPSAPVLSTNKTSLCNGESTNIVVTAGNGSFAYIKKNGGTETAISDFNSMSGAGEYFVRTSNSGNGITCPLESNHITISTVTVSAPTVTSTSNPCNYSIAATCNSPSTLFWYYGSSPDDSQRSGNSSPVVYPGGYNINFKCEYQGCNSSYTSHNAGVTKGTNTNPNWQDTGINSSCSTYNYIRTCTKEQRDNNPCSSTANTTKDVIANICNEIMSVVYIPEVDGFQVSSTNNSCSSDITWYYTGNGEVDTYIGTGFNINGWKGGGRYEAKCNNHCGTTCAGTAYKD